MIFALITVVITVHAYVFYSLYVVNGTALMQLTDTHGVLDANRAQGGVYMCGRYLPIWAVVLIEFCFAYTLEVIMGSPLSFKLACRKFDPRKNHPMIFESAIITATVCLMCPAMSLIAAFLYYPYYAGFSVVTLLCTWFKLVCVNLPFAYFGQMFFIQPFVRFSFRTIFAKDIAARQEQNVGTNVKPKNEVEAIQDVIVREKKIAAEDSE